MKLLLAVMGIASSGCRGTLLAPTAGGMIGRKARSYVCQHDTAPPGAPAGFKTAVGLKNGTQSIQRHRRA